MASFGPRGLPLQSYSHGVAIIGSLLQRFLQHDARNQAAPVATVPAFQKGHEPAQAPGGEQSVGIF